MRTARVALISLAAAQLACAGDPPQLMLDHAWLVVATGAPERAVL